MVHSIRIIRTHAASRRHRLDHTGALYELATDPGQARNIATEQPEIAARLFQAVRAWRKDAISSDLAERWPFPVGYREFPVAELEAAHGVPHGNIKRSSVWPSASYFRNWIHKDDRITWDVEVATTGRYAATVYYTCSAEDVGSTIELSFGKSRVTATLTTANDPPLRGAERDRVPREAVQTYATAWTYRTGDATANSQIQCNPLIVDGVLYGTSAGLKHFALDAAGGRERWSFDPFSNRADVSRRSGVNRGLVFCRGGAERRILYTAGPHLHAIDPDTGRLIVTFGIDGRVDLLDGLGRDTTGLYLVDVSGADIPYTTTGYKRFLDPDGYPALRPPWGTLNAIDLNTGEYRWKRPLGELPELTAQGIPPTGAENYGGPLVTAGGVVLIAATRMKSFVRLTRRPANSYGKRRSRPEATRHRQRMR
jgi:outer membrane protein assembly factor BamB